MINRLLILPVLMMVFFPSPSMEGKYGVGLAENRAGKYIGNFKK